MAKPKVDLDEALRRLIVRPHGQWEVADHEVPAVLQQVTLLLTRLSDLQLRLEERAPRTARILGRSLREVRGVLQLDEGSGFDVTTARQRIGGDDYAVRRFLADLVTDEWLVQDRPDHWTLTARAKELQFESRGRLTRAKADALVAGLLKRVRIINADVQYAFKVDAVVVFGSYLSARDRIGDVDVAVDLEPRYQSRKAQDAAVEAARDRCKGRTIFASVTYPIAEVWQALKARSRFLDICGTGELDAVLKIRPAPFEVIHGHWTPPHVRVQAAFGARAGMTQTEGS